MAKCWELRGCDEEMQADCPHASQIMDRCPSKCAFATCDRPTHALTSDPALVFSVEVDRGAAIKDVCTYCEFFIINGPRL
jgi:hypothetical protein